MRNEAQNKSMITKIFTSEEDCENHLSDRFGQNHKPTRNWSNQTIRNYYKLNSPDDTFIVVVYDFDQNVDSIKDLILNLQPNTHRGDIAVYEGTVSEISEILGLTELRSQIRSILDHLRVNTTLVKHSVKDNLYPKTKYAIGAYWRISRDELKKKTFKS